MDKSFDKLLTEVASGRMSTSALVNIILDEGIDAGREFDLESQRELVEGTRYLGDLTAKDKKFSMIEFVVTKGGKEKFSWRLTENGLRVLSEGYGISEAEAVKLSGDWSNITQVFTSTVNKGQDVKPSNAVKGDDLSEKIRNRRTRRNLSEEGEGGEAATDSTEDSTADKTDVTSAPAVADNKDTQAIAISNKAGEEVDTIVSTVLTNVDAGQEFDAKLFATEKLPQNVDLSVVLVALYPDLFSTGTETGYLKRAGAVQQDAD